MLGLANSFAVWQVAAGQPLERGPEPARRMSDDGVWTWVEPGVSLGVPAVDAGDVGVDALPPPVDVEGGYI